MDVGKKPCILLVRFETSDFVSYRNSIKRGKSVLYNYGGTEIAMTRKANVVQGTEPDKFGMGVLGFPTVRQAEMWLQSERCIGQQDWLGGVDIICVPLCCPVDDDKKIWLIGYVSAYNRENDEKMGKMAEVVHGLGCHFVAQINTGEVMKWRGTWSPPNLIVEQWPSIEALQKAKDSEDLAKIRSSLADNGTTHSMVFEHEDIASPAGSPQVQRKC